MEEEPMILPKSIPESPTRINDTAPVSRWAYDILECEGEEQFRRLVEEIKIKCAALYQVSPACRGK